MFHRVRLKKFAVGCLGLVIFCLGAATTARADQVTIQGLNDPNLQATINITSLTNASITFSATNVLVAGVTSSITGIGFALPGTITANTPGACSGSCGNFGATPVVANSPGNVPGFGGVTLDWAVITGPTFTGGNPPGINQGQTATFIITGGFTGLTQANFLDNAYVRFQSVVDPNFPEVGSDVAHNPTTPVPEPSSLLLLGAGLSMFGLLARNRLNR